MSSFITDIKRDINRRGFETFNDGFASVYMVTDISEAGDQPVDGLDLKKTIRFDYKTIGIKRNYEALQAQVKIDEMISIRMQRDISTQDIITINADDTQYEITQVQHKKDTLPPTSLLSLTRLEANYDIKGL